MKEIILTRDQIEEIIENGFTTASKLYNNAKASFSCDKITYSELEALRLLAEHINNLRNLFWLIENYKQKEEVEPF